MGYTLLALPTSTRSTVWPSTEPGTPARPPGQSPTLLSELAGQPGEHCGRSNGVPATADAALWREDWLVPSYMGAPLDLPPRPAWLGTGRARGRSRRPCC